MPDMAVNLADIPPIHGETLFFWGNIDGPSKEEHCSSCLSNHHHYQRIQKTESIWSIVF